MPAGRPSKFGPDIIAKAKKYRDGGWVKEGDAVPQLAGLACYLKINRSTVQDWMAKYDQFSAICDDIMVAQERALANGGLVGGFAAPITKMMLAKHGYQDRVETDHKSTDGSMTPTRVERVVVKPE